MNDRQAPATDIGASQGVQVGTGNTQINNWGSGPRLSESTLAALSPRAAADRIRRSSHDEAVNLFARASAGMLVEVIGALLEADVAMAVAILADLPRDKIAELISSHDGNYPWLVFLSHAAEVTGRAAGSLGWDHETGAGRLELAARSPQDTDGYVRQYRQGRLYWSTRQRYPDDSCLVRGSIARFHETNGSTRGKFGFPQSAAEADESARGTKGEWQEFEGGFIASSDTGAHHVLTEIAMAARFGLSSLGFPIAPAAVKDGVESQDFEGGTVYSSDEGTFAVRLEIAARTGHAWVPISTESAQQDAGPYRVQRFRDRDGALMAMYSPGDRRAIEVTGRVLVLYEEFGGPACWLGLPTANAEGSWRNECTQAFEHGVVYSRPGCDAVAVPVETAALVGMRLGWPMSAEQPIGDNPRERIQFFERGIVTLRDGKRDIWRGPEPAVFAL